LIEQHDHPRARHDIALTPAIDRWVELRTSYGFDGEVTIEAVVEGRK